VAVTEAIGRITRRSDRMAREGDDLVALLRRTLAKRAREFYAVNTARLVAEATAEAGCPATVSFGIASLTEHLVRSPEDMMEKAFQALAAARRAGPGSVVVYDLRLG
jgi:GGDEF domain-containing protein